jgi:hypothetical protein
MMKTLTHTDIQNLLEECKLAIELDQIRVDAMPKDKFHPQYDDAMWRAWRADHVVYIDSLLKSVGELPSIMLTQLTRIALSCEPKAIQRVVLELFSEAVSGSCSEEELATAKRFFGWLVRQAGEYSESGQRFQDARRALLRWMADVDPLWIARDPECGYADLFAPESAGGRREQHQ